MHIRVDKIFIEEMNKRLGTEISYNEFKALYKEIKNVRDNDPVVQARKRRREAEAAILQGYFPRNSNPI